MNSTYLISMNQKYFSQCKAEIAAEEERCKQDIQKIKQQIDSPYSIRTWTPKMFLTYGIQLLIFLLSLLLLWAIDIWQIGATLFMLDVVALFLADSIFTSKRNTLLNAQITQREEACKKRCDKLELQRDDQIQTAKNNYLQRVENAQLKYGGSTVINPVVTWLCDQMILKIKSADQRQFITHIQTELRYRVDCDKIVILEYRPHAEIYSDGEVYSFFEHSFFNLPDLFRQIGCALALAKLVEFELVKRISDSGYSTEGVYIAQDNNDNTLTLSFTAPNPSYVHPVDLGEQD